MTIGQANKPAADKAGIALLFAIEYYCSGLSEPGRSPNLIRL